MISIAAWCSTWASGHMDEIPISMQSTFHFCHRISLITARLSRGVLMASRWFGRKFSQFFCWELNCTEKQHLEKQKVEPRLIKKYYLPKQKSKSIDTKPLEHNPGTLGILSFGGSLRAEKFCCNLPKKWWQPFDAMIEVLNGFQLSMSVCMWAETNSKPWYDIQAPDDLNAIRLKR